MITRLQKFIQMNKPAASKEFLVKYVAGLVIIYNKKILLVHAKKHPKRTKYTFPKGQIEKFRLTKQTILDTAINETYQETKVTINKNEVDTTNLYKIKMKRNGELYKVVYYYVVYLTHLNNQPVEGKIISKDHLQHDEVDWAGFLSREDAKLYLDPNYESILKFIM